MPQARDEYIKGWFLLRWRRSWLGRQDGFVFIMSVVTTWAASKAPKIDGFLEAMKDASQIEQFVECRRALRSRLGSFKHFGLAELEAVSPHICNCVTISTMHGCPPAETERIASVSDGGKGPNLLLKCNPTLVGFEYAEGVGRVGFTHIQMEGKPSTMTCNTDAVPMLERLQALACDLGLYSGSS